MKKAALLFMFALTSTSPIIAGEQKAGVEVRGLYNHYIPSEDLFDGASGYEGSLILWGDREFGIGFSGGSETWDVYEKKANSDGVIVDASGDVDVQSAGVSFYFRPGVDYERLLLTWSLGLRYASLDPDVNVSQEEIRYSLKEDEAFTAKLGLDLGFIVTDNIYLFGGAGYQFDVSKPNLKAENISVDDSYRFDLSGLEIGDLSLGGLMFNAGLGLRF